VQAWLIQNDDLLFWPVDMLHQHAGLGSVDKPEDVTFVGGYFNPKETSDLLALKSVIDELSAKQDFTCRIGIYLQEYQPATLVLTGERQHRISAKKGGAA
jgi:hypothetical protein